MPTTGPESELSTSGPGAAVIGAGGLVGARLVRALEAVGVPTARFTRSRPFLSEESGVLAAGLCRAPVIFYLATSVNPGIAERFPERVDADHELFTRMLRELQRAGLRPAVVLASSGTVYDPETAPPYDENAPTRDGSAYGAGKLRMESTLLAHADLVRPVVVRLASVYGPGGRTAPGFGVIPHWLTAVSAGRPVELIGDPEVQRDFVYLDDVVDALLRIHVTFLPTADGAPRLLPDVLNIGSGAATSLTQLLRLVSEVTGREPVIRRLDGRGFDRRALSLDVRRAAATIGWRPRTTLVQGLTQTWLAMREGTG